MAFEADLEVDNNSQFCDNQFFLNSRFSFYRSSFGQFNFVFAVL